MKMNPRLPANLALVIGVLLLWAWPASPAAISDQLLGAAIFLSVAGLVLRLFAPDSRAQRRPPGAILDLLGSGLLGAALVALWWNRQQEAERWKF